MYVCKTRHAYTRTHACNVMHTNGLSWHRACLWVFTPAIILTIDICALLSASHLFTIRASLRPIKTHSTTSSTHRRRPPETIGPKRRARAHTHTHPKTTLETLAVPYPTSGQTTCGRAVGRMGWWVDGWCGFRCGWVV